MDNKYSAFKYIKNVFKENNIDDFNTNQYLYHFIYRGRFITFVNQDTRLCVNIEPLHEGESLEDESELYERVHLRERSHLSNRDYRDSVYSFILNGSIEDSLRELFSRIMLVPTYNRESLIEENRKLKLEIANIKGD
ncbi:MAG: hypothetical protein GY804_03675 [Alphaproteobacteria bacterium]|nr:hypothetical protein [Alphaproteobacteria bacterium]